MQDFLRLHLIAIRVTTLTAWLTVMLWGRFGQAAVVAVDFNASLADAPGVVCVVWQATPPTEANPDPPLELSRQPAFLQFTALAGSNLYEVARVRDPGDTTPTLRALRQLGARTADCANPEQCAPHFTVALTGPSKLMRCGQNTQVGSPLVAVIELQTTGSLKSDVSHVFLHGLVARIELARDTALEAVTTVVIGGDYRPGSTGNTTANRVQLPLSPRCVERTLRLNGVGRKEKVLTSEIRWLVAQSSAASEKSCTVGNNAAPRILLPAGIAGLASRVLVERSAEGVSVAKVRADWSSEYPPEEFRLRSVYTTFTWKAACELPERIQCPEASLPEAGVDCRVESWRAVNQHLESCSYSCGPVSGDGIAFEQPARLRFVGAKQDLGWEAWVAYAGQELDGAYLPSSLRRLFIDLEDLPHHSRYGDRYPSIEVTLPSSTHARLRVDGRDEGDQSVVLPGVSCGQQLAYHWLGSRRYHEATTQVSSGTLHIAPPEVSSEEATLGASLNGGFMIPTRDAETIRTRPYAIFELAYRKAWGPHVPWPCGDGVCPLPHAYELHGTYIIAGQPFVAARSLDGDAKVKSESAAYNRFILSLVPVWHLGDYIQLGVGMGVGVGYAVMDDDSSKLSKTRVFPSASLLLRYPVTQQLALEGLAQYLWNQDYLRFENDATYSRSPQPQTDELRFLTAGLGIRGWM